MMADKVAIHQATTRLDALITRQWPLLTPAERLEVEEMHAEGETALLRELMRRMREDGKAPSPQASRVGGCTRGDGRHVSASRWLEQPLHDREANTVTRGHGQTELKVKRPRLYKVTLVNDDFTPREFVVLVLKTEFGLGEEQANRIMVTAHQRSAARQRAAGPGPAGGSGPVVLSKPLSRPPTLLGKPTMVLGSLPSVCCPKARRASAAASCSMVAARGCSSAAISRSLSAT